MVEIYWEFGFFPRFSKFEVQARKSILGPGEALNLTTDGDLPLQFEKWTLSDTNF